MSDTPTVTVWPSQNSPGGGRFNAGFTDLKPGLYELRPVGGSLADNPAAVEAAALALLGTEGMLNVEIAVRVLRAAEDTSE